MHKDFKVEILKSNKKDELGYNYDSFKIISKLPEIEVKKYCMEILRPSYHKNEMPHPHVYELIKFKNIIYTFKIVHLNLIYFINF